MNINYFRNQEVKQNSHIRNVKNKFMSNKSRMSVDRLWNILRFSCFGNQNTWVERLQNGEAVTIHVLKTVLNETYWKDKPTENLRVDFEPGIIYCLGCYETFFDQIKKLKYTKNKKIFVHTWS